MFDAVVLMGGFGTRLNSISNGIPKPMMPVNGVPFVYRLFKKLENAGCSRIICSLHYQAAQIIDQINNDKPVNCDLIFVVEEEPLGTGGALKLASDFAERDKFLALNGDTYSSLNFSTCMFGKFFLRF